MRLFQPITHLRKRVANVRIVYYFVYSLLLLSLFLMARPQYVSAQEPGGLLFTEVRAFGASGGTRNIAVGDMNGDGFLDIVTNRSAFSSKGGVYLNDGSGNFNSVREFGAERADTKSIAVGDMDGDGDMDIVTGNSGTRITIYFNDGIGNFPDEHEYGVKAARDNSIAIGDVDGNGSLDVVSGSFDILNFTGAQNTIYLNNGIGDFGEPRSFGTGTDSAKSVALGDMDGDGDLDFVIGSNSQSTVYMNNGDGNFDDPRSFSTGSDSPWTQYIALGDMDNDGDFDIVLGSKVYLNDGAGNFRDGFDLSSLDAQSGDTSSAAIQSIAIGDMDGDGTLDIVTGYAGKEAHVYLNDGAANFAFKAKAAIRSDSNSTIALADVNGDGVLDIIMGNSETESLVYLNSGTGNFNVARNVRPERGYSASIMGDMDGDGSLDIVTLGMVYANDGTANFHRESTFGESSNNTNKVLVGDLDGNGTLDIVAGNSNAQSAVYLNDGSANFTEPRNLGVGSGGVESAALGDLDDDGDLDIVLGSKVYLNDGDAYFEMYPLGVESVGTGVIAVGDIDGDGDLDIVAGKYFAQGVIYLNDGVSRFQENFKEERNFGSPSARTKSMALGDMNGDGYLDIVAGNWNQQSKIYLNDGAGNFDTSLNFAVGIDYTEDVNVGDVDGDGDLDIIIGIRSYADYGVVYQNDGMGKFPIERKFGISGAQSMAVGDVDNDGDIDIVMGLIYFNQSQGTDILPNNGPTIAVSRPVTTGNASFYSTPTLLDSVIIPITYALFDPEADPVGRIEAFYSFDKGGSWLPAIAASNTVTLNLPTGHWILTSTQEIQDIPTGISTPLNVSLNVQEGATLADIEVWFTMAHSNTANLAVSLESPAGIQIPLVTFGQLNGQNITDTHFSSYRSSITLESGTAHNGVFQPSGDLTSLRGGNTRGDWKLLVYDNGTGNSGVLHSWGLRLKTVPTSHVFEWDTFESDFFGQSDNVVFRMIAYSQPLTTTKSLTGSFLYTNSVAGPYQRAIASSTTFPFRVRGSQAQVFDSTGPVNNALIYRLPADRTNGATPMGSGGVPFRTDQQGFLQGRGELEKGDRLVALWPTDIIAPATPSQNFVSEPITITDSSIFTLSLAITDTKRIGAIKVWIRFAESPQTPLSFHLLSPQGKRIPLIEDPSPEREGVRVFVPDLRDDLLIDLRGDRANGEWRLEVDQNPDSPISLREWGLTLTLSQLYYTSNIEPMKIVEAGGVQTLTVSAEHPLQLFDLDVSLEWDARKDTIYLEQLRSEIERTSELLYDWTNGQAALGKVTIYQNKEGWDQAHIRILASNRQRPNADLGGYITENLSETVILTDTAGLVSTNVYTYTPGHVRMPVVWNRFGDPNSGNLGEDWPRALAHELGHYLFFLQDTYLGLKDDRLIPVAGCPGVMSDPYRDSDSQGYDEFNSPVDWSPGPCDESLSKTVLGRADWATIIQHYPWMRSPTVANSNPAFPTGPNVLPLAVTQVNFDPVDDVTSTGLAVPFFSLVDTRDKPYIPTSQARTFLFGSDRLIDLGNPGGDQFKAWGASEGQRLCVFDLPNQGCLLDLSPFETELKMTPIEGWEPDVVIHPLSSTTILLTVTTGISIDVGDILTATLYPIDQRISDEIATTHLAYQGNRLYTGSFTDISPTLEAYVHIYTGTYEIVTDFVVGGAPGRRGPRNVPHGGVARYRYGGGSRAYAPVLSNDGQTFLYGKSIVATEDQLYSLQTATSIPEPPLWATPVGQAYRLLVSNTESKLTDASLSINYREFDVPIGEEDGLAIYFWSEATEEWVQLLSEHARDFNLVVASIEEPGLYALMSSVNLPLVEGWNLVGYTLPTTQTISSALASIADKISIVYGYKPNEQYGPWQVYSPDGLTPESSEISLDEMSFGSGYLIYATEPVTWALTGGMAPLTATSELGIPATGLLKTPPATYSIAITGMVGVASSTNPIRVVAYVDGQNCAEISLQSDSPFLLQIPSLSSTGQNCAKDDEVVHFEARLGQMLWVGDSTWNNSKVQQITLLPYEASVDEGNIKVCQQEILVNGGFENGTGWEFGVTDSTGRIVETDPYSGMRSALLGLLPSQHVSSGSAPTYSSMYQRIRIPLDIDSASLSYRYKPGSEDANRADSQWAVIIKPYSSDHLKIIKRALEDDTEWRYEEADLSDFRGQAVRIYFEVRNDSLGPQGRTWMYVDDVSLRVCD